MAPEKLTLSPLSRRQIEADFFDGHIISDAGLLLLREVDKRHRPTQQLASALNNSRNPELVRHKLGAENRSVPVFHTVFPIATPASRLAAAGR